MWQQADPLQEEHHQGPGGGQHVRGQGGGRRWWRLARPHHVARQRVGRRNAIPRLTRLPGILESLSFRYNNKNIPSVSDPQPDPDSGVFWIQNPDPGAKKNQKY